MLFSSRKRIIGVVAVTFMVITITLIALEIMEVTHLGSIDAIRSYSSTPTPPPLRPHRELNQTRYDYDILASTTQDVSITQPTEPLFSSHQCRGDNGDVSPNFRYCEIKNLCFKPSPVEIKGHNVSTGEWFYFVEPDDLFHPFMYERGTYISFANSNLIRLQRDWPTMLRTSMKIKTVYYPNGIASVIGKDLNADEEQPQEQEQEQEQDQEQKQQRQLQYERHHQLMEDIYFYNRPVVLSQPTFSNFGHILGDELFPAFQLSDIFNVSDWQYVLYLPKFPQSQEFWQRVMDQTMPAFSSYPIIGIHDDFFQSKKDKSLFCFSSALISGGSLSFNYASFPQTGIYWAKFRELLLQYYDLNPFHKPPKQKVLIWSKGKHRRNPTNLDQVAAFVAKTFKVEVVLAEWYSVDDERHVEEIDGYQKISQNVFTVREQLELVLNATAVITPAGGLSYVNLFQAIGATQIIIDYWQPVENRPAKLDTFLWTIIPYIETWNYQFLEEENVLDPDPHQGDLNNRYKYRSRVVVNLPRMALYVQAALFSAERKYGLGKHSFERFYSLSSTREEIEKLFLLLEPASNAPEKKRILEMFSNLEGKRVP
eukprot:TRINITY_DN1942_c0_g3_i2.p1 TRINITY_DN1942_c0_g3~~TRINITY_DN1942_c0_g3_i2.p1  ORF type:complete len:596 (-),score=119.32 TRINITY_DN1942_c0_g3_i2:5-1792(-)